ncbi:MAG: MBL fold metallo-hydrolase [Verrucomicrobiales bacterium]|nr:MBL fold metallo-hydrolase [Verrucomicrobiales bacterium]
MIPLEDNFNDVIGKAQRGLKLTDEQLAAQAGISTNDLSRAKSGQFDEAIVRKLARPLNLGADRLSAHGKNAWYPKPSDIAGLASFNTPYEDITVNSYLVWDPATKQAAVFDTGADATPMLHLAEEQQLAIKLILLTHTHVDHVADLQRLKAKTGAPAYVGEHEGFAEAEAFGEGKVFPLGNLKIETRQTSGHARGGITYVVLGLSRPVAIVGDAIFASSMGGGLVSYEEALRNNRRKIFTLPDDTVLCPGHGPLTTVGEEKLNNPFYPEFQKT